MIQTPHARTAAVVVACVIFSTLSTEVALAADVSIAVGAPESVAVGDHVEVKAIVTSAGEPVEGAIVGLAYGTSLAGVIGDVELDREATDASGVAILFASPKRTRQQSTSRAQQRSSLGSPEATMVAA